MTRNAFRLALAGATMLAGLGTATIWSAPGSFEPSANPGAVEGFAVAFASAANCFSTLRPWPKTAHDSLPATVYAASTRPTERGSGSATPSSSRSR